MYTFIVTIARLIDAVIWAYSLVVVARAVTSWLPLEPGHPLRRCLEVATEPLLQPIRKALSRLGWLGPIWLCFMRGGVLYLDREEAAPSVVLPSVIGRLVPAHCTALGKVLLAYNPEEAARVTEGGGLPKLTPHTISDPGALKAELARVRDAGYALDDEEFHEGNFCVAAPVRNYRGTVVAAISVSLAKSRLDHEPKEKFVQAVVSGADSISRAMGYDGG